MNILQEKCFAKEWLDEQRAQMRRVDPGLLEKSIHALELVGLLAHRKIPFSFKGGTCMLLLLENIRRLSIDVDIACTVSGAELESILREIEKDSRFENLATDKLTAFAPSTIGVKYSFYGASMKILKHCADVGALYDQCEDMEKLCAAYNAIWPVEESFREKTFSREQILDDTIEAARLISMLDLRGCPSSPETEILRTGIRQLDSHIIGSRFTLNEAKICAAKVAWLATALKQNNTASLPRYNVAELQELAATPLQNDLAPLNRLKGGSPEAYYFWLKTNQLG